MIEHLFVKRLELPCSAHEAFEWHASPGALEKLIPPEDPVRVVSHRPGIQGPIGDGARVVLALGKGPFKMRWIAFHEGYLRDRRFIDVEVHGPLAFWRHTHSFVPAGDAKCVLEDHVEYALPFGSMVDFFAHSVVRRKIERMFEWRHRVTYEALNKRPT